MTEPNQIGVTLAQTSRGKSLATEALAAVRTVGK